MAEKGPKAKAKPAPGQRSVLGTLPAKRPERLGAPRKTARANGANGTAAKPAATKRVATPRANGAAPKPAAVRATAAKPAAATRPRPGPTAVRPASPPLQSHQRATEAPPPRQVEPPRGTELVTT